MDKFCHKSWGQAGCCSLASSFQTWLKEAREAALRRKGISFRSLLKSTFSWWGRRERQHFHTFSMIWGAENMDCATNQIILPSVGQSYRDCLQTFFHSCSSLQSHAQFVRSPPGSCGGQESQQKAAKGSAEGVDGGGKCTEALGTT